MHLETAFYRSLSCLTQQWGGREEEHLNRTLINTSYSLSSSITSNPIEHLVFDFCSLLFVRCRTSRLVDTFFILYFHSLSLEFSRSSSSYPIQVFFFTSRRHIPNGRFAAEIWVPYAKQRIGILLEVRIYIYNHNTPWYIEATISAAILPMHAAWHNKTKKGK